MEAIKGAIFDLDGTLFDSLWVWEEIDKRFLHKRGLEVPLGYAEAIGAMNFRLSAEYTIRLFGLDETPEALMKEWMEMAHSIYANEIKLKPLAKEFLLELYRRGVKLGIATSSTQDLYMPALENNEITDLFSVIMDTTETRGKDFPDIYLAVAEKLKLAPSECVVFEDLPLAIKSAKSGGFKTVAVLDKHSDSIGAHADYRAKGFDELLAMVK